MNVCQKRVNENNTHMEILHSLEPTESASSAIAAALVDAPFNMGAHM